MRPRFSNIVCLLSVLLVSIPPAIAEKPGWFSRRGQIDNRRESGGKGAFLGTPETAPSIIWTWDGIGKSARLGFHAIDVLPDAPNEPVKEEFIDINGGRVFMYDSDNSLLWSSPTLGHNALHWVGDLDGNGTNELVTVGKKLEIISAESGSILNALEPMGSKFRFDASEAIVAPFIPNPNGKPKLAIAASSRVNGTDDLQLLVPGTDVTEAKVTSSNHGGYANGTPFLAGDIEANGSAHELLLPQNQNLQIIRFSETGAHQPELLEQVWPSYQFGLFYLMDVDANSSALELVWVGDNVVHSSGASVTNLTGDNKGYRWNCLFSGADGAPVRPKGSHSHDRPANIDDDPQLEVAIAFKGVALGVEGNCPQDTKNKLTPKDDIWTTYVFDVKTGAIDGVFEGYQPKGMSDLDGDGKAELLLEKDANTTVIFDWSASGWSPVASTGAATLVYSTTRLNTDMLYWFGSGPQINMNGHWRPIIERQCTTSTPCNTVTSGQAFMAKHNGVNRWVWLKNGSLAFSEGFTSGSYPTLVGSPDNVTGIATTQNEGAGLYSIDLEKIHQFNLQFAGQTLNMRAADLDAPGTGAAEITLGNRVIAVEAKGNGTYEPKLISLPGLVNIHPIITDKGASVNPGADPWILTNNGTTVAGAWNPSSPQSHYYNAPSNLTVRTAQPADVDSDGKMDVLLFANDTDVANSTEGDAAVAIALQWNGNELKEMWTQPLYTMNPNRFVGVHSSLFVQDFWHETKAEFGSDGKLDLVQVAPTAKSNGSYTNYVVHLEIFSMGKTKATSVSDTIYTVPGPSQFILIGGDYFVTADNDKSPDYCGTAHYVTSGGSDVTCFSLGENTLQPKKMWHQYRYHSRPQTNGPDGMDSVFAPIDSVGGNDMMLIDSQNGITVHAGSTGDILSGYPRYLDKGQLLPAPPTDTKIFPTGSEVVGFDANGNGDMELVYGTEDGWLYAVTIKDTGPELLFSTNLGIPIREIVPADWNGDGIGELVILDNAARLYGVAPQSAQITFDQLLTANGAKITCKSQGLPTVVDPNVQVSGTGQAISRVAILVNGSPTKLFSVVNGKWSGTLDTNAIGTTQLTAVALSNTSCVTHADCSGQICHLGWCSTPAQEAVSLQVMSPTGDADKDGVNNANDCAASCGYNDKNRGPGFTELCDLIDNDCNGKVDDNGGLACSDQLTCTQDACNQGQCTNTVKSGHCLIAGKCYVDGQSLDGQSCTGCNSSTSNAAATTLVDGSTCDDANACTLSDTCLNGQCKSGQEKTCDPPDQCEAPGQCSPDNGECEYDWLPNSTSCDDANPCTLNDTCLNGQCAAGQEKTCDPPDQCEAPGQCSPDNGECEYDWLPNSTSCDDANPCTLSDTCLNGQCASGQEKTCDPPNQCEAPGQCSPDNGECEYDWLPNGTSCDDANACTLDDACVDGACNATQSTNCPPKGSCTGVGSCNPAQGTCTYVPRPNGSGCNDHNACTSGDSCQDGHCVGGTNKTCQSDTACMFGGECNPKNGQCEASAKAKGSGCSDGNACTVADQCDSGICNAGQAKTCSGSALCVESYSCNSASGECEATAKSNGTPCDDGNACTTNSCQNGQCQDTPLGCNDNITCTIDTCDTQLGCLHTPNSATCMAWSPSGDIDGDSTLTAKDLHCLAQLQQALKSDKVCSAETPCGGTLQCRTGFGPKAKCVPACVADSLTLSDVDMSQDGLVTQSDVEPMALRVLLKPAQDYDGDGVANTIDTDNDNDGSLNTDDCAPLDPNIHSKATEVCDGVDNDCDGTTDGNSVKCTLTNALSTCQSGSCTIDSCNSGYGNCDNAAANGCEQSLNSPQACGTCGNVCSGNNACKGDQCINAEIKLVSPPTTMRGSGHQRIKYRVSHGSLAQNTNVSVQLSQDGGKSWTSALQSASVPVTGNQPHYEGSLSFSVPQWNKSNVEIQLLLSGTNLKATAKDVVVDSTPPTITDVVLGDGSGTTKDTTISWTVEVIDATSVVVQAGESSKPGSAWAPLGEAHSLVLSPGKGQKTITIWAKDSAGHIATFGPRTIVVEGN